MAARPQELERASGAQTPSASSLFWAGPQATPSTLRSHLPTAPPPPDSSPPARTVPPTRPGFWARRFLNPLPRIHAHLLCRRPILLPPGLDAQWKGQCLVCSEGGGTRAGPEPLLPSAGTTTKTLGGEGQNAGLSTTKPSRRAGQVNFTAGGSPPRTGRGTRWPQSLWVPDTQAPTMSSGTVPWSLALLLRLLLLLLLVATPAVAKVSAGL